MTETFPDLPPTKRLKATGLVLVVAFVGFAAVIPLGLWLGEVKPSKRTSLPQASFDDVVKGRFTRDFEAWSSKNVPTLVGMEVAALTGQFLVGVDPDPLFRWPGNGWGFLDATFELQQSDELRRKRQRFFDALRSRVESFDGTLTVCLAPNKAMVYPEFAGIDPSDLADWEAFSNEIADSFRALGATVVEPLEEFRRHRDDVSAVPLYARTDSHWNPRAVAMVNRRVLDAMDLSQLSNRNRNVLLDWSRAAPVATDGGDSRVGADRDRPYHEWLLERRPFNWILTPNETGFAVPTPIAVPGAPVLLCGDSFGLALAPLFVHACPAEVDRKTIGGGVTPWAALEQAFDRIEQGEDVEHVVLVSILRLFQYDPFGEEQIRR